MGTRSHGRPQEVKQRFEVELRHPTIGLMTITITARNGEEAGRIALASYPPDDRVRVARVVPA